MIKQILKNIAYILSPMALLSILSGVIIFFANRLGIPLRGITKIILYLTPIYFFLSSFIVLNRREIKIHFNIRDILEVFKNVGLILIINFVFVYLIKFITGEFVAETQEVKNMLLEISLFERLLVACLLVPIGEEFFFRKGLHKLNEENKILYYLFASLGFGIAHIQFTGSVVAIVGIIFATSSMGFVLARSYNKNKNILICVLTHAIINCMALL